MALFAELDNNNNVLRVLVSNDDRVEANGGHQSQQAADDFGSYTPFNYEGVKWVETSTDGSFRGNAARVGGTYDPAKDVFLNEQPFASWILDDDNEWKAPVDYPQLPVDENGVYDYSTTYNWDEDNQKWIESS
tara:strand:- start:7 stop:405 length:399 start_codon:yes stop_codon:yes gene_type:complete